MQNLSDPSGFLTNKTGEAHGLDDGWISPLDNNSSIYYFIKSYSYGPYLYGDLAMGLDPLVIFIL